MRTLRLYHFRHFDELRGCWMLARYVAEPIELRCRYRDFELVGPPEIWHVPDDPLALSAAHLARGPT